WLFRNELRLAGRPRHVAVDLPGIWHRGSGHLLCRALYLVPSQRVHKARLVAEGSWDVHGRLAAGLLLPGRQMPPWARSPPWPPAAPHRALTTMAWSTEALNQRFDLGQEVVLYPSPKVARRREDLPRRRPESGQASDRR